MTPGLVKRRTVYAEFSLDTPLFGGQLKTCRTLSVTLAAVGFAFLRPVAAQQPDTTRELSAYEELQLFSGVLNHIRANYMDSVRYHALMRAAIDGMLHSLDPHSYYLSRRDFERQNALERGDLPGIGAILDQEDSAITVLTVIRGSPAAKAGVQPGDRVTAINDTVVAQSKLADVSLRLAGPEGSTVQLRLERGTRLEPDTVSVVLTRKTYKLPSVYSTMLSDHLTGFVRLEWFGPKAGDEVRDAVRGVQHRGAQRLILDLRDNPGGLVDGAVDVASEFLPTNTLVFRTRGRKSDATKDFGTSHEGPFRSLPLIVLVNERSASAAEALAGSLQDHDRALIVGRRTFGKALAQAPFLLTPSGDVVMLTIARVLTPSGRIIQRRYQSLGFEQYLSFAGKGGAAEDTTAVFKTDRGREVRGGGGIAPDVLVAAPPGLPAWWSVAADSGFDFAVADSLAATLPATPAAREQWIDDSARWSTQLLQPYLQRVRSRLHVNAQVEEATAERISLALASRVADVRWPPDGASALWMRHDPDVRAALANFGRLDALLGARPQ